MTELEKLTKTVNDLSDRLGFLETWVKINDMHRKRQLTEHGYGDSPYPANWTPEDVDRLERLRTKRLYEETWMC